MLSLFKGAGYMGMPYIVDCEKKISWCKLECIMILLDCSVNYVFITFIWTSVAGVYYFFPHIVGLI